MAAKGERRLEAAAGIQVGGCSLVRREMGHERPENERVLPNQLK